MKKDTLKKVGFIVCIIASVMVIGSTAAGWFKTDKNADKVDDGTTSTAAVAVIDM